MSLVELEDVTRTIILRDAPPLHILQGVDLAIESGARVSVVGRSGSGKSTLLNILGLVDTPSTGFMRFDDRPVRLMNAKERDRMRGDNVGFIFQQFNLIEGLSATENVAMPLVYCGDVRFWRRRDLAREMLDRVGLGHRLDAPVTTLSGGEQQRVAIARALVRSPRLILADEPTGALDIDTGEAIMALLDAIAEDIDAALVVITHDQAVASRARTRYALSAGVLTPAEEPAGVPG
ncbi:MAG TPA: ABC transporter ATP-binding protein [Candidatus Agrococcus pullicola]|uniref:ABC transporter ATP-binding protein n=1 Tax=Candidatus Agrococcus pullicola TaxID=2838429 RepID=A0A9D1YW72_9MICO|nr:ABC transporter ATP-binding protein [Candidatus Agrococcus pullicola]